MAGTAARGGPVTAVTGAERTLGAAVDAFLAQPRPVTTARTYTRTLERLAGEPGSARSTARQPPLAPTLSSRDALSWLSLTTRSRRTRQSLPW